MAMEMIDGRKRQLVGRGERLRSRGSHEQRSDQPRSAGNRDERDLVPRRGRRAQSLVDDLPDQLEVMARGDLWDHPAVAVVDPLRGDHVGADLPLRGYDRCAGVIAAGFEGENHVSAGGCRGATTMPPPEPRPPPLAT